MANNENDVEDHCKEIIGLLAIIVTAALVGLLLVSLSRLFPAILFGHATLNNYSSFASSIATILLVLLTAGYVFLTGSLVDETRKSREDEIKRSKRLRIQIRQKLRLSIREEIETGLFILPKVSPLLHLDEFIDDIEEKQFKNLATKIRLIKHSPFEYIPTTIYRNNSGDLGILTEIEVELIVMYYSYINMISDIYDTETYVLTIDRKEVKEFLEPLSEFEDMVDGNLTEQVLKSLPFDRNDETLYKLLGIVVTQIFGGYVVGVINENIDREER